MTNQFFHLANPAFLLGLSRLYRIVSTEIISKLRGSPVLGYDWETMPPAALEILGPILQAFSETSVAELEGMSSTNCRNDLDNATRSAWEKAVEGFYREYGYEPVTTSIKPSHVAVQMYFLSEILRDAYDALTRGNMQEFARSLLAANRFITVHLMPTLKQCNTRLAVELAEVVKETLSSLRPLVISLATAQQNANKSSSKDSDAAP